MPPRAISPLNPQRRRLLKGALGATGLGAVPWLSSCGSSSGIGNDLPGAPASARGIHVSLGADTRRERLITWFTDGPDAPRSVLEFGPALPGQSLDAPLPGFVEGNASPIFEVNGFTHRAKASGLDADLPMRYRVGDGEHFSPVRVVPATPADGIRFCHFGDNGVGEAGRWVRKGVEARQPHFFLVAGDLCYADGNQPIWDEWFDQLEPLAATIPMMSVGGNHEAKDGNGEGWLSRVSHPEPLLPSRGWYTYDVARTRFVASTGGSFVADARLAEEILFVETTLAQAAVDRLLGRIDFIVFTMHYTIWTDQAGRSPNNPTLVLLLENILLRYGVDIAAVGHDHIYQRSQRFALGLPNPLGYIQVTAGGGGQSMRGFDPISNWSASAHTRFSFVEYEVSGEQMSATTFAVDTEDNGDAGGALEVIDSFTLQRRSLLGVENAVLPAREPSLLLADIRRIEGHTRLRNSMHLQRAVDQFVRT